MLGTYVCKYFSMKGYDIVPISRKDIDLSTVTKSIVMHSTIGKGDVVINCAGLIKQRKDTTVYDFIKVNTMFPHLLAEVCDAKKAKLIHISTDCFLPGTLALTNTQYKPIQSIEVGDIVRTHTGGMRKVLALSSREVDEEVYVIKTWGNDTVRCTANHPWFSIIRSYKQKPELGDLSWNDTKSLQVGNLIAIPKIELPTGSVSYIDLSGYNSKYSESITQYEIFESKIKNEKGVNIKEFCRINGLPLRKFYAWNSDHSIKPKFIDRQNKLSINKDTSWFLGLFLAEGWVDNSKRRKTITISLGEEPKIISRATSIVREYLHSTPVLKNFKTQRGTQITFTHQTLSEMLSKDFYTDPYNKYSHTKTVPDWIQNIGKDNIKSFLLGYFEGDGCLHENGSVCNASMSSVSESLINNVKLLLMMCGILASKSINRKVSNNILGREVNSRIAYVLSIGGRQLYKLLKALGIESTNIDIVDRYQKFYENDNYWFVPITHIHKESYIGSVYNMEVDGDHSYLVNGGLSAHNCVYNGNKGGYDEESIHDSEDIYGRSKSLGEPENASVIRTSIIGEEKFNQLSLIEWVKSNKGNIVNGFVNHTWNGITCLEFAKVCEMMIKENLFWKSVKHVHSPTVVTKCDLVEAISRIYDLEVEVTPTETDNHCFRDLKSIRDDIVIEVPELYTQIEEIRKFKI